MQLFRFRSLESELEIILARNLVLRLLLAGGDRWAGLAVVLAIGYFGLGIIMAVATNSLIAFLHSRSVYVLLIGVVVCVTYACWYPPQLVGVLAAVPRAFRIEPQAAWKVVERWTRFIYWPIPLAVGVIGASVVVWLSVNRDIALMSLQNPPPIWFIVYRNALLAVCWIMGGAVEVFLATILLLAQLFQFELKLSHYQHLSALSSLSTGLTIGALVAVALFILLVFTQVDIVSLAVASLGIVAGGVMFAVPQFSYQGAVVRAKRVYLNRLGALYEQCYGIIEQDSVDYESLETTKKAIEALQVIKKDIEAVPMWLLDVSDAYRALLSLLAPFGSLLINAVLSRLI